MNAALLDFPFGKEIAMGRPRKDATAQEIRERLIEAMSNRLVHEPINAVTVASLIEEVGCNRSTFYYHFVNVAQLSEVALDAAVPVDIPLAVLSFIQKGIPPRKENLEGSDSRRTKADASDSEDGLSRSPLFASINIPGSGVPKLKENRYAMRHIERPQCTACAKTDKAALLGRNIARAGRQSGLKRR